MRADRVAGVETPWITHARDMLMERRFFSVRSDRVSFPGGGIGDYDWVEGPDMVRVAALLPEQGEILLVEQTHYLAGTLWQAPGGGIGAGESPEQAAARELLEETGFHAADWRSYGSVWPLPGLTGVRVHLFAATGLSGDGRQDLEDSEADLVLRRVRFTDAVAATDPGGLLRCAPSAQLILSVAAHYPIG